MIPKFTIVLIDPDRYAVYDGDGELYAGGDQSELPSTLADGLGTYDASIMTVVSVDAADYAPPIPETIDELIERCFEVSPRETSTDSRAHEPDDFDE